MIEALGMNTTVVATATGASGVKKELCGEKLVVVPDDNWQLFVEAVVSASTQEHTTPEAFYNMYSWKKITQRVAAL